MAAHCPQPHLLPILLLVFIIPYQYQNVLAAPSPHVQGLYSRQSPPSSTNATHLGPHGRQTEPSWRASPSERGTLQLLVSCAVTIILAVWSSVIVNVQKVHDPTINRNCEGKHRRSPTRSWTTKLHDYIRNIPHACRELWMDGQWKTKAFWAFLNVLIPEIALAVALCEWRKTSMLLQDLRRLPAYVNFEHWDRSRAFYTIMGGYYIVIDPSHPGHTTTPQKDGPRKVLTTKGFMYIAHLISELKETHKSRCQKDPDDTDCQCEENIEAQRLSSEINDMTLVTQLKFSSQDRLPRLLFLFQASWMIAQVISRFVENIPTTMLELHGAAHVAIAMVRYLTWWSKPVDMTLMTKVGLTPRQYSEMQQSEAEENDRGSYKLGPSKSELESPGFLEVPLDPAQSSLSLQTTVTVPSDEDYPEEQGGEVATSEIHRRGSLVPRDDRSIRSGVSRWWSNLPDSNRDTRVSSEVSITESYFTSEAKLGKEVYQRVTGGIIVQKDPFSGIIQALTHGTTHWQNWKPQALIWFCTSSCYIGVHFLAWNWHYPSEIERVWFLSCAIYTASGMAGVGLVAIVGNSMSAWNHRNGSSLYGRVFDNGMKVSGVVLGVGALPWLLARLCMFVLAWISIRSVPIGAYRSVKWAEVIPHV